MILLAFAFLALLVAVLAGGDIRALADVRFRSGYLAILAVVMQIVIFSGFWERSSLAQYTPYLYVASFLVLTLTVGLNWQLPGLALLGIGLLSNTIAVALNGGRMPASPEALRLAGLSEAFTKAGALGSTGNSILMGPDTLVPFLCDIFPLPAWFPLRTVFSVGDVLIAVGAAWFFWVTVRRQSATQ